MIPETQMPEMPGKGKNRFDLPLEKLRRLIVSWFSGGVYLKQILPYPTTDLARERANDRRQTIRRSLLDIGDARFLSREFIETPPNSPSIEPRSLLDNVREAIGQIVRLRWQLEDDELLLIERVVDAIMLLKRQEKELFAGELPLIRLEPMEKRLVRQGYFPWKVVVETNQPAIYKNFLYEIHDWLGIGIDVAPRRKITQFGLCQMSGGREGTIGGMVTGTDTYAVTCAHVISPDCGSVRFRSQLDDDTAQPDAALLDARNPCFPLPDGARVVLTTATDSVIKDCIKTRTTVNKLQNSGRTAPGYIRTRVSTIPFQGILFRFPHLEIKPNRMRQWGLRFPLFRSDFSVDGDSGAWVTDGYSGSWLGMVVGGADDHSSWVIEAEPLLSYLEDNLATMGLPQKLIPERYT